MAGSFEETTGYVSIRLLGPLYMAHRLAFIYMTGESPKGDIDHRNKVRNDNRWVNLRRATRSQNNMNSKNRVNSTTGYRGVSWSERDKHFHTYINFNGTRENIGYFQDSVIAAKAYDKRSKELYGEFAYLNFPEDKNNDLQD